MRCHICDTLLITPRYNRDLKAWEPCDPCMEVISDCLNDMKDNAVWVEDDLDDAFREAEISPDLQGLSHSNQFFT